MCESLLEALRDYSEEQKDYDKMIDEWIVSYREYSEEPQTCICGQYPINELCYIIHKKTNERLCLGNRCIEHFGTFGICPECKIYEIDKITHHKCNNCRRKETRPSGLVLFGKHKGKEYELVWNKDASYCDWVLNTPDFKDIHFRNYLLRAFLLKYKKSFKCKNSIYSSNNGQRHSHSPIPSSTQSTTELLGAKASSQERCRDLSSSRSPPQESGI